MTAWITLATNAEGTHKIDLEDIVIHNDGILEYLIYYLFDEDTGLHKELPEASRELRGQALRESGYIIESVDDDDDLAEHFFKKTESGINSFNLSDYSDAMDLIDGPGTVTADAICAYLEWAGEWSRPDFDCTYQGSYESDRKFAESIQDRSGEEIPEWVRPYFDWDAYARDVLSDYHECRGHYFN